MSDSVSLFLCGDVMTGRGVDQVLPYPSHPELHEPYVASAVEYVQMAERASGPIPRPVTFSYIWGEAAAELKRRAPGARIVNLETSVTTSDDFDPKGINYRMQPDNTPCLSAAGIECCALANNHVLDWGQTGLAETLSVLHHAGIKTVGAGSNPAGAWEPAVLRPGAARILVFACATPDSGVPVDWAVTESRPGVALLSGPLDSRVHQIAEHVLAWKRPGDVAVLSIHWGPNWGYTIPQEHRLLAYRLIDHGGIDVIHGHSSHHPKPIEVYRGRLILYGCGDFLNDYEGIGGYEEFRSRLVLMYFVMLDPSTGNLQRLDMVPHQIERIRLKRASRPQAEWLRNTLTREGKQTGTQVVLAGGGQLVLRWSEGQRDQR